MELISKTNSTNTLYMLSGLSPYRHPYISNVCFMNKDNKAIIKQLYIEPYKPIEFIGPSLDDIRKVYISSNNKDAFTSENAKLIINENNILPLIENKDAIDTLGLIVYDVNIRETLKDPLIIKRNIDKGILEYHLYKEQLLLNSLFFTLYGSFGLIFIMPNLCISFTMGGLINMLYLFMLYKQIDNVGKNNEGIYNYITRLSVIFLIAYFYHIKMELYDYKQIISAFFGFMTGKLAFYSTPKK